MGRARQFLLASGALAFVAQPVAAQDYEGWDSHSGSEVRGTVSITIPLSGKRKARNSAARVDFALQSYQTDSDQRTQAQSILPRRSLQLQSVMSLTLEQSPRLLLNGSSVANFGPQSLDANQENDGDDNGGSNTALYVVGGVLLAGFAGALIVATDVKDAASDFIGPAD